MTVLVGVLCRDGVVVGSDSSATFGSGPGQSTIEQPARKTFLVGTDLIFETTGAGGLGQRLEHILQRLRQEQGDNWHGSRPMDIALTVSHHMLQNMQLPFLNPGQLGALVAFACQDGFHLYEFAVADFQPEMKTADTWFVTMGSGQMIADPFFGLLRRTLFRQTQPNLAEGILAAYWALYNAIDLNTGGINGPVQLAVLRRPSSEAPFEARLLGKDELEEHHSAVMDIEKHLADYRALMTQPPPKPPPVPPPA
jgi:20S proteasome alpha/beta subunit